MFSVRTTIFQSPALYRQGELPVRREENRRRTHSVVYY
jgi:hypothetical protein